MDADAVFGMVVLNDALDRSSGYALVEHDRLLVEDSPAVAHVGVQARRVGAPTRVYTGG